ncbi:MAG: hypothetical protein K2P57_11175 [Burkholderiales bacterium]|nr:hypothetical protein [Burkholderiales bacterium]
MADPETPEPPSRPRARKVWATPEICDQMIKDVTLKAKFTTPVEGGPSGHTS